MHPKIYFYPFFNKQFVTLSPCTLVKSVPPELFVSPSADTASLDDSPPPLAPPSYFLCLNLTP